MKDEPYAASTDAAVRHAMEQYRKTVLDAAAYDPVSGLFRYRGRISREAVLELADVGRSTLKAAYHTDLRAALDQLVRELKGRCGKRIRSGKETPRDQALPPAHRADLLMQELAAMEVLLMKMEADAAPKALEPVEGTGRLKGGPHRSRGRRMSRAPSRR